MKRHKRTHKLPNLSRKTGRPLTTAELAEMIGMSCTFIRTRSTADICGRLASAADGSPCFESRCAKPSYVKELGLL